MTLQVLQSKQQIAEARQELMDYGLSAITPGRAAAVKRLVQRSRLGKPIILGDNLKSWDVLSTVEFLKDRLDQNASILDIGCYASELIVSLRNAGFTNLTGIDLNPNLPKMPYDDEISYVVGNFMETPFEAGSFSAITSISVIEHGFDGPRLFAEVSRLLKPGGCMTASFDFWPDKIDTRGTRFFDMDWLIFSRDDILNLVDEAAQHGLHPTGNLDFSAGERAIEHGGFQYTFGWLALEKPS